MPGFDQKKKEEEIAANTLIKLREDIAEAEKRRSFLQNEISAIIQAEKTKSDEIHDAAMRRLEADYQKKLEDVRQREKYLDDYMVRLDKKESEIATGKATLEGLSRKCVEQDNALKVEKEAFNKEMQDERSAIDKQKTLLADEAIRLRGISDKLKEAEESLNQYSLSLKSKEESIQAHLAEIQNKIDKNNALLREMESREATILRDRELLMEEREKIEEEKRDLIKLSATKDDLLKLLDEKKGLDEEKRRVKVWSTNVENREKNVVEREITANEKEKYLILRDREVDAKIALLKKIRAGENA